MITVRVVDTVRMVRGKVVFAPLEKVAQVDNYVRQTVSAHAMEAAALWILYAL